MSRMPRARHDLDATAVVIHTSGTTAAPRPVELTYGNLLWSALGSAVALGLDPEERWLCALPLSHVGGLSILLRSAIYATTRASCTSASRPSRCCASLQDGRGDAREPRRDHARAPARRGPATPAGAALRADRRRPRAGGAARARPRRRRAGQPHLRPDRDLLAGDHDARRGDRTAARRAPARRCSAPACRSPPTARSSSRGPTVAPGALAADGWLHTGDLGELDERGRLRVSGRKADTIVSGGENVAPAEVEAVLEAHPQVLEAAVLGRADAQWGEAVTAIVVARAGEQLDVEELRAHCAGALAPYKVPKRFVAREPSRCRARARASCCAGSCDRDELRRGRHTGRRASRPGKRRRRAGCASRRSCARSRRRCRTG